MKKLPLFVFLLILFAVNFLSVGNASAATNTSIQAESAKILNKLGIVDSSKTSSKILKTKIKKYECIALVVKMLGYDTDEETENVNLPYKDVDKSHKEYNNIKIAYKYGVISGKENSSLSPNGYVTYADALRMVINGLGYGDEITDSSPEDIIHKSSDMEICNNLNLSPNKQLTYGEVHVIICNSLTVDYSPEG